MSSGDSYKIPTVEYQDYKKDPDNFVKLALDIPNLKALYSEQASNATTKLEFPSDSSFIATIEMKGESTRKYRLEIEQLPAPVYTDETSTIQVTGKETVVILLHKKEARRWDTQLEQKGLEWKEDES